MEHDLEESDHSASDGGRGNFANVDRDNKASSADAPTSDKSSDVDGGKMAERKHLDEGANFKDCSADHQSEASSDFFGEGEDPESAEEATTLETRYNIGRVEVDGVGVLAGEAKVVLEGSQSNDAANKLFPRYDSVQKILPLCHNRTRRNRNW